MINQNWVFGINAGLDFSTNPPTPTSGYAIQTGEGCASVSDTEGNLLFYTDGSKIWDADNVERVSGLLGDSSSTQSSIIVADPGNPDRYYVFTADGSSNSAPPFNHFNGIWLDITDWSYTPLSELMLMPSNTGYSPAERITAVQRGNCEDVWVINVVQQGTDGTTTSSGVINAQGVFRVFRITPNGISFVGDTPMDVVVFEYGYLKSSHDGKYLAVATNYQVVVYPFDPETGTISPLAMSFSASGSGRAYGIEFSPDNKFIYYTLLASGSNQGRLYQADLTNPSAAPILLEQIPNTGGSYAIAALQLGIDNRIYIAKPNESEIGAILNPNEAGLDCNVVVDYLDLPQGATCRLGFPNIMPNPCEVICKEHIEDNPVFEGDGANVNQNWVFGINAGLDFSTTPPTPTAGAYIDTIEGVASVSTTNGHLLFYTDGVTVWDWNNNVKATGLLGDHDSTQSAIIVPNPSNGNQYYIFTTDGSAAPSNHFNGVLLDIFDWAVAPLSDIMEMPNTNGYSPTEKLVAIQHQNTIDTWVITAVQQGSDGTTMGSAITGGSGVFRVFKVSATGVELVDDVNLNHSIADTGYLKASLDGEWLAAAGDQTLYLYAFNNETGAIALNTTINAGAPTYGVEFSPNSNLLYYTGLANNQAVIRQFDLNNQNDIIISVYSLPIAPSMIGALQLGPDGIIYIARDNTNHLDAIIAPNTPGISATVTEQYIALANSTASAFGLPPLVFSPSEIACIEPPVSIGGECTPPANRHWVLGNGSGLDFSTDLPTVTQGYEMDTPEGIASISDADGNLLFYTNGVNIWNSNHDLIFTGLLGNPNATQSATIVPFPDEPNLYYILTVDGSASNTAPYNHFNGVVLNVTDWSVTPLSDLINLPSNAAYSPTEKLTIIPHKRKTGYWVLTIVQEGSEDVMDNNIDSGMGVFRLFSITADGIIHIGDTAMDVAVHDIGYMKSSLDGHRIAIANTNDNNILIYYFNPTIGLVSEHYDVKIATKDEHGEAQAPYGLEFSPNGNYLYYGNLASGTANSIICQVDLKSYNHVVTIIGRIPAIAGNHTIGALQLANDGRIYISRKDSDWLAAITNPDQANGECAILETNFLYLGTPGRLGLPNLTQIHCPDEVYICNEEEEEQSATAMELEDHIGTPVVQTRLERIKAKVKATTMTTSSADQELADHLLCEEEEEEDEWSTNIGHDSIKQYLATITQGELHRTGPGIGNQLSTNLQIMWPNENVLTNSYVYDHETKTSVTVIATVTEKDQKPSYDDVGMSSLTFVLPTELGRHAYDIPVTVITHGGDSVPSTTFVQKIWVEIEEM